MALPNVVRVVIKVLGVWMLLWTETTQSFSHDEMKWWSEFRGMEGWVIAAVTQVDGSFSGCEYDRAIAFINGMVFKCSEYKHDFSLSSFSPGAVIFVKTTEYEGKEVYEIKVLIGAHVYGMAPKFAR